MLPPTLARLTAPCAALLALACAKEPAAPAVPFSASPASPASPTPRSAASASAEPLVAASAEPSGADSVAPASASVADAASPTRPPPVDVTIAATELRGLRVGMHVRVVRWDRPITPEESGHPKEVSLNRGRHGVIVRFARRTSSGYTFDVAIVRWDAQTWHEWVPPFQRMKNGKVYDSQEIQRMYDEGPEVALGSFEAATHPELLEAAGR